MVLILCKCRWERLEVPLVVTDCNPISGLNGEALSQLSQILADEELQMFKGITDSEELDHVTQLHNAAVYTRKICRLLELTGAPLLQALENRLVNNEALSENCQEKIEELKDQIETEECRLKSFLD